MQFVPIMLQWLQGICHRLLIKARPVLPSRGDSGSPIPCTDVPSTARAVIFFSRARDFRNHLGLVELGSHRIHFYPLCAH